MAFVQKDDRLAAAGLTATFAVYAASLSGAALLFGQSLWALPLILVAGLSMIRIYVLQHDFGHLSYFSAPRANRIAGHVVSLFTFAPFRAMQYNHNLHHAGVGDLDHRETGEVYTMTLAEWESAGPLKRLQYRLYRHPLVMLGLGAFFIFLLRYRWPKNARKAGPSAIVLHNVAVAGYLGALYLGFGWQGLAAFFAAVFAGGILGSFLVYLQHNFEDTYWEHRADRDTAMAALIGSSQLDLGRWFDILTANINWHDLHHLNPQIPSYRLRACHARLREDGLLAPRLIGWGEAIASLRLKLWDEEAKRLVPYPRRRVLSGVSRLAA